MSFFLAKFILIIQQNNTLINPNTTTPISSLSIPPTSGDITTTPRITCPALSEQRLSDGATLYLLDPVPVRMRQGWSFVSLVG